jgi:hypothetical protein
MVYGLGQSSLAGNMYVEKGLLNNLPMNFRLWVVQMKMN